MMRVLIISHEPVGQRMAGPAIRCWEMAHVLGRQFDVTLAAPQVDPPLALGLELLPFDREDPLSVAILERRARQGADVVISHGHLASELTFLQDLPVPWVADVYVPTPVESLAWHRTAEAGQRLAQYEFAWRGARAVAQHADFLLCASERQRDFWLGTLAAFGRLRPELDAQDAHLRQLIDVVPFGCPAEPPQAASVLKGVVPGIAPDSRVILWGGGVWNWFDPLTLLRAMPLVLERHPRARLLFMGANHPDVERVPEMARAQEARELSRTLNLESRAVFWGDWAPYTQRGAYLMEADIGVSLHLPGAEARLAFRTRLLDAIWAGLPMVSSSGDVLGEKLAQLGLALTVPCGAIEEVAQATNALLDEPDPRAARRPAFETLRREFAWDRALEPLVRFCHAPHVGIGKQAAADLVGSEGRASQEQVAQLRATIQGYESGQLMRLLAGMHRLRRRLSGSRKGQS